MLFDLGAETERAIRDLKPSPVIEAIKNAPESRVQRALRDLVAKGHLR